MEKIQNLIKECIFKKATKIYLMAGSMPIMYGSTNNIEEDNLKTEFTNEDLNLFLSLFTGEEKSSPSSKKIIDWEIPNFGTIRIVAITEGNTSLTLYMPSGNDLFLQEVNIVNFDISMSESSQKILQEKERQGIDLNLSASSLPPPPDKSIALSTDSLMNNSMSQTLPPPPPAPSSKKSLGDSTLSSSTISSSSTFTEDNSSSGLISGIDIDFSLQPNSLDNSKNPGSQSTKDLNPKNPSSQPNSSTSNEIGTDSSLNDAILDVSAMLQGSSNFQKPVKNDNKDILESPKEGIKEEAPLPSADPGFNIDELSNIFSSSPSSSVSSKSPTTNSAPTPDPEPSKEMSMQEQTNTQINLDGLFGFSSSSSKEASELKTSDLVGSSKKKELKVSKKETKSKVTVKATSSSDIEIEEDPIGSIFQFLNKHTTAYIYEGEPVSYKTGSGFEKLGTTVSRDLIEKINSLLQLEDSKLSVYSYADTYYLKTDLSTGIVLSRLKTEVPTSTTLDTSLCSPFLSYKSGIIFSRGLYKGIKAQDVFVNFVNENFERFILNFDSYPTFYHRNRLSILQEAAHDSDTKNLVQSINPEVVDIVCICEEFLNQDNLFDLLKLASKTLLLVHTNYSTKSRLIANIKQIVEQSPQIEDIFTSLFLGLISLGNKNEIDYIKTSDSKKSRAS